VYGTVQLLVVDFKPTMIIEAKCTFADVIDFQTNITVKKLKILLLLLIIVHIR
jgi:hypothetical protein